MSRTSFPRLLALCLVAVGVLFATACEKPRKKPVLTKDQMRRIQAAVLKEAPTPQVKVGANFGDKIELIGVDIKPKKITAGEEVRVTWYWRCKAAPAGPWKLFVHLEKPGKRRATFDHHAVDGLYMIEEWKPGEIIKDEQVINTDAQFPGGPSVLYVGIFDEEAWAQRQQNVRLEVKDPGTGKHDGNNRLEVTRLQITAKKGAGAAAEKRTPISRPFTYTARPAASAPTLDGKLDDPAWQAASWSRAFRQPDGKPLASKLKTRAKVVYDADAMYVAFEVTDPDIASDKKGRDNRLWEADVVELYLDPGHDTKDYVELQFAPTGEVFDAHFESRRHPAWPDAAARYTAKGLAAKVLVNGTLNKAGDQDTSWTVEAKVPFKSLPKVSAAPKAGDKWGFNLYRIDAGADRVEGMGALQPVGGDFHDLSNAAWLAFGPAKPAAAPKAPTGGQKLQVVPQKPAATK